MRQVFLRWRAHIGYYTFVSFILWCVLFPQSVVASTWAPAARLPISAQELVLAGSDVALVSGSGALSTNPGGLAHTPNNELQATHLSPMVGTTLDGVSVVISGRSAGWGVGVQQLASTGIPRTGSTGEVIGTITYNETALTVAGAQPVGKLTLGVALRGIWQDVDNSVNSASELVVGLQRPLMYGWYAGVVASHLWRPLSPDEQAAIVDTWSAGLSYAGRYLALHAGGSSHRSSVAAVIQPMKGLHVRMSSVNDQGDVSYRFGLGINGKGARLDYAYVGGGQGDLPHQLPLGHVVSVRFAF